MTQTFAVWTKPHFGLKLGMVKNQNISDVYNWWWESDGCVDRELVNEFEITEVTKDEIGDYSKANLRFVV